MIYCATEKTVNIEIVQLLIDFIINYSIYFLNWVINYLTPQSSEKK